MIVREAAKVRNRLTTWYVTSDTTPGVEYTIHNKRDVVSHRKIWTCNCPDFTNRRMFSRETCKHIHEVIKFRSLQVAREAAEKVVNRPVLGVGEILSILMAGFAGDHGLDLWNLVSFLRGPDTNASFSLKLKTTAVMRVKLGMGEGLVDTNFINEPFGIELLREYMNDGQGNYFGFHRQLKNALINEFDSQVVTEHFSQHYGEALIAAFKLGYIK